LNVSPLTITKCCVECRNLVVKIPLVTGASMALWCNEHLAIANEVLIARLGQPTHNIIFSVLDHQVWFWERDIQMALQAALDTLFEDVAQDLHNVENSIYGLEDLIRVKAKEFIGVIEFSQQKDDVITKILPLWMSADYIYDIGGPLGKNTTDLFENLRKGFITPGMGEIMVCLALSAKRAASYQGCDNSAMLINVERNIWNSHKITLGATHG